MADQPLALQWLCFIRDHGTDLKVTLGERALASLLPTYGQGKNIFVSMVTLSKTTGWSRNTVKKHRDGLIAKGLLEDITGDPDKQLRTYRLTTPVYVCHEPGQNLTTPGQILTTPDQNLTTPWSKSDHNIKPLDQELDQARTSSPARPVGDDGEEEKNQGQSQNQAPAGEGPAPFCDWDDPDDGGGVAKALGVPLASIGQSFRTWLEEYAVSVDFDQAPDTPDTAAWYAALDASASARNPVG